MVDLTPDSGQEGNNPESMEHDSIEQRMQQQQQSNNRAAADTVSQNFEDMAGRRRPNSSTNATAGVASNDTAGNFV